ncbi:MAG: DUF4276 family protein [Cytophagales bacterium]|nr:DUF4276 family protein [Cytophagales bacterium]
MARLLVHVEGDTEEMFVNDVLAPHLLISGFTSVSARKLGNGRQRAKRHGIKPWSVVKEVICDQLIRDGESYATLIVDYYALPATGNRSWPGRDQANNLAHVHKASHIQNQMHADLQKTHPNSARRFIPFVVMHELEGLLFSDCQAAARGFCRPDVALQMQRIRNAFDSPEHINDSPQTAPAKRLNALIQRYEDQKPWLANLAAIEIGLATIRRECLGFNQWLSQLEDIGQSTA